jgi:hypothetical protein
VARPILNFEIDPADLRRFDKALRTYAEATKKDVPYILNRSAMNLAFRACSFTHQANKEAIRAMTGVNNVYALVNWNRSQKGLPGLAKAGREAAVRKFIAARVRAVGFIRAGWLKPARKLQKVVRGAKPAGVNIRGLNNKIGKGTATLARASLNAFSEIVNQSTSKSPTSPAALVKHGGEGLRKAVRFVTNDMLTYAREKLAKNAAKFNRR